MSDHAGISRVYLAHPAVFMRSGRHIGRQVKTYAARERDIEPLEVRYGSVFLVMKGTIATIRLFL